MQDLWTRLSQLQPITERQTRYGELWALGMSSLQDAQETPDKSNYLQSGYAFVQAVRNIPNRPEAWLGLSYLLYLLGDEATALYYVRQVLEQTPDLPEATELYDLLYSSHQLNRLMDSVSDLHSNNQWDELPPERMSENETLEVLHQAQALLQIQHQLLSFELDQGRFLQLAPLKQRQGDLEALRDLLRDRLIYFEEDSFWGPVFKDLFAQLDQDMLALRQLELLFEAMQSFQQEVQSLFTDLTRRTLRLRVQGAQELAANQEYIFELFQKLEQLSGKMANWPAVLRSQAETSSGWNHMLQQTRQFQEQLNTLMMKSMSPP
ncbi:MAG: hypothetical protein ACAI44_00655 [Candidatus Sericytochromatia bacterium]